MNTGLLGSSQHARKPNVHSNARPNHSLTATELPTFYGLGSFCLLPPEANSATATVRRLSLPGRACLACQLCCLCLLPRGQLLLETPFILCCRQNSGACSLPGNRVAAWVVRWGSTGRNRILVSALPKKNAILSYFPWLQGPSCRAALLCLLHNGSFPTRKSLRRLLPC